MRDFVLNDASLPLADQAESVSWLLGVAKGMAELISRGIAQPRLRTRRALTETKCAPNFSIFDAYLSLMRTGNHDFYVFLMQLSNLVPVHQGLDEIAMDRFQRCEAVGCDALPLTTQAGEPLVLCAITGAIAVNCPTKSIWKRDQLDVIFNELLPDGSSIAEVSETVNSLAAACHATAISDRLVSEERTRITSFTEMWDKRQFVFNDLVFGPDVPGQLRDLNQGYVTTVRDKLAALDSDARRWRESGGAAPSWSTLVTDESASVKQSPKLSEYRRFTSTSGEKELFLWHARFGHSGRIHLRVDASRLTVEIGYIGDHLPL